MIEISLKEPKFSECLTLREEEAISQHAILVCSVVVRWVITCAGLLRVVPVLLISVGGRRWWYQIGDSFNNTSFAMMTRERVVLVKKSFYFPNSDLVLHPLRTSSHGHSYWTFFPFLFLFFSTVSLRLYTGIFGCGFRRCVTGFIISNALAHLIPERS